MKRIPSNFWLLSICLLLACQWFYLSDAEWSMAQLDVIKWDGRGYYDYLRSIFIEHDLADQQINDRYIVDADGKGVNKYFAGTALLMLPFFLIAWLIAGFGATAAEGLGAPFQWMMVLSALCYTTLGVHYVRQTLWAFAVHKFTINLLSFSLLFGTNLLYYSAVDLTASHAYSFFAIAGFAYFSRAFFLKGRPQALLTAAVFLGLVLLIRPVNGLVILMLPFLAGNKTLFMGQWKQMRRKRYLLGQAALIVICLISVQLALYKAQTGAWFIWSYADEGFYFTHPAWVDFLFSFKRGWWIYTPFFLLLIPALVYMWRRDRWCASFFSLYFLLTVYVLSSWWSWHYGGSFGSRVMVDHYALLLLPIGWLLRGRLSMRLKTGLAIFVGLVALLNVVQVHQIDREIMSSWHMNFGKYVWSLGKLDAVEYAKKLGGRDDTYPFHQTKTELYAGGFRSGDGHWKAQHVDESGNARFDHSIEYNLSFRYEIQASLYKALAFDMQLTRTQHSPGAGSGAYLVIEILDGDGQSKAYDAFRVDDFPSDELGKERTFAYRYVLPSSTHDGDQLRLYVWNKGLGAFSIQYASLALVRLD